MEYDIHKEFSGWLKWCCLVAVSHLAVTVLETKTESNILT